MPEVDKKKIKTVFLRKRKSLTDAEYDKRNAKLFYSFSQLIEDKDPKRVHVFLPIEKQKEVDTWIMIKYLRALGIEMAVSRMSSSSNDLEHFILENRKQLEENHLGILEPKEGKKVEAESLDMVLVPLVIFDQQGHRVGYGKGYYDKFLSQCNSSCIKVGLSLLNPVDELSCVEPHDVSLDFCISPLGFHDFTIKQ